MDLRSFPPAVSSGLFPQLSVLHIKLPWQLSRSVSEIAADVTGATLRLLDEVDVPADVVINDERVVAAWAFSTPNVRRLSLSFRLPTPTPTLLDALTPLQALRHLVLDSVRGVDHFDDTLIAGLLASLPGLVGLSVGAQRHFATAVAFAPAAFDPDLACPGLRELNVARQCGIRKEGLDTIVRLFPNLRTLDVRGCFGLRLSAFAAAMLEDAAPSDVVASATTGGPPTRRVSRRLRLRKLRRVVASYRRRVPKALNFIEYHCGNFDEIVFESESDAACDC
jgi:hypothetical protein